MSWTLCTSGAAVVKAGKNANTLLQASGSVLAVWSDDAEGRIEAETRRSWVSNYASLPTGIKGILADVSSSLIAQRIISFDPTNYLNSEADRMMNVNEDRIVRGLKILEDFKSPTLQNP